MKIKRKEGTNIKKIIGIIVIVLLIPVVIITISDIDRTPIYPTTEFNIEEKITRISSFDIENGIELPKLPIGVGDRWLTNGRVERNVGKVVLDGTESWNRYGSAETSEWQTIAFRTTIENSSVSSIQTTTAISSHFLQRQGGQNNPNEDWECFFINGSEGYLYVRIFKSRLDNFEEDWTTAQKINAFRSWLSQNNVVVIYHRLAEPIIENAPSLPNSIDYYDGGTVIVDDGIIDYTIVGNQAQINFIEGNITTVVDGQFNITKPTKIISKSNDLYDYDLSTLPKYLEYGTLSQDTYNNTLELINNNQNKQIKIFFDDNIQDSRYNIYLENDVIIINNDTEVIRIYNDNSYTSTRNLDTDITYKLEGYHIIDYIDGKFDNTVLAFFWVIPALLVGGLIYLLLKRKE